MGEAVLGAAHLSELANSGLSPPLAHPSPWGRRSPSLIGCHLDSATGGSQLERVTREAAWTLGSGLESSEVGGCGLGRPGEVWVLVLPRGVLPATVWTHVSAHL